MPENVSSDFSYTLTYLTLEYKRNRIFHPCRESLILSDFYIQALLTGLISYGAFCGMEILLPRIDYTHEIVNTYEGALLQERALEHTPGAKPFVCISL